MWGSLAQEILRITGDSGAPDVGAIADLSCTSTAPRATFAPAIHRDLAEREALAPPNGEQRRDRESEPREGN